jgi:hypothetical protein
MTAPQAPHDAQDPYTPHIPRGGRGSQDPHGRCGSQDAQDPHGPGGSGGVLATGMPEEMAELMAQVVGPDGGQFGHREHVHLAFLAVRRYGTGEATVRIGRWIRHIAAYHRAPQKYNATVTRAWTEIVGEHIARDPASTDFDKFAARHPALLDKRLLTRHYSPAVLASAQARTGWAAPDRVPFPWHS